MKALGLCTLLALLIGCTEADVAIDPQRAQTSDAIKSVQPAFAADKSHSISSDLPIKYYKSVAGHDDTCGFKDSAGRIITLAIYDHCGDFHDGMAYVTYGYDTIGYVDTQGKIAIPVMHPIFFDFVPEMRDFSEGKVAVFKDDKWGYVDKQGKLVIPYLYRYVGDFSSGLATVLKDGKFGAVDHNGVTVIDFRYDHLGDFKEGLASFKLNDEQKIGFMDTKGKIVIEPSWDAGLDFSEDLAAVGVGDFDDLKWGFIDSTGKVVIEPQYDEVLPDVSDLSLYEDISGGYFKNGTAKVYLSNDKITEVTLDKEGNEIQRHVYDSYEDIFNKSSF